MSNIQKAFENGKAFIPFITCGDPSLDITEQLVYAAEEAGADLIELGIPFSDPTAEGPVIQAANLRALTNGVTTDDIFDMVRRIRKKTDIPMVFMTYANVVFSYGYGQGTAAGNDGTGVSTGNAEPSVSTGNTKTGAAADRAETGTERFIRTAAEIGMDGLILPDVPYEEKDEFDIVCRKYGLDFVSLIAPTSHERIKRIAADASGFVYCVSSMGVTGVRSEITTDVGSMVKLVKEAKDIPCAVGFGISTPEQAAKMAALSDGAIVGSAIVRICGQYGKDCVPHVKEYIRSMKEAL